MRRGNPPTGRYLAAIFWEQLMSCMRICIIYFQYARFELVSCAVYIREVGSSCSAWVAVGTRGMTVILFPRVETVYWFLAAKSCVAPSFARAASMYCKWRHLDLVRQIGGFSSASSFSDNEGCGRWYRKYSNSSSNGCKVGDGRHR